MCRYDKMLVNVAVYM